MEIKTILAKVEFNCKKQGIPMHLKVELPLDIIDNGSYFPYVDEDYLIIQILKYADNYGLTDISFPYDFMGQIDWNKCCNIKVVDNE